MTLELKQLIKNSIAPVINPLQKSELFAQIMDLLEKGDLNVLIKKLTTGEFFTLIDLIKDWCTTELLDDLLKSFDNNIEADDLKNFESFKNFNKQDPYHLSLLQWAITKKHKHLIRNIAANCSKDEFINLLRLLDGSENSVDLFQEALNVWDKEIRFQSTKNLKVFKNFQSSNLAALIEWLIAKFNLRKVEYSSEHVEKIIQLLISPNDSTEHNSLYNYADYDGESPSLNATADKLSWIKIWKDEIQLHGIQDTMWINAFDVLSPWFAIYEIELEKIKSLPANKRVELALSLFKIYEDHDLDEFLIDTKVKDWKEKFDEALNQDLAESKEMNKEFSVRERNSNLSEQEKIMKENLLYEFLNKTSSVRDKLLDAGIQEVLNFFLPKFIEQNIELGRMRDLSNDKFETLIKKLYGIYAESQLRIVGKDELAQQIKSWKTDFDTALIQSPVKLEAMHKELPAHEEHSKKQLSPAQIDNIVDYWENEFSKKENIFSNAFPQDEMNGVLARLLLEFIEQNIEFEKIRELSDDKFYALTDDLFRIYSAIQLGVCDKDEIAQQIKSWKTDFDKALIQNPAKREAINKELPASKEILKEGQLSQAQINTLINYWDEFSKVPNTPFNILSQNEKNYSLVKLLQKFMEYNVEFEKIDKLPGDEFKYLAEDLHQIYLMMLQSDIMGEGVIGLKFKEWKTYFDKALNHQGRAEPVVEINEEPSAPEESLDEQSAAETEIKQEDFINFWQKEISIRPSTAFSRLSEDGRANALIPLLPKFIDHNIEFKRIQELSHDKFQELAADLYQICFMKQLGINGEEEREQLMLDWKKTFNNALNPGLIEPEKMKSFYSSPGVVNQSDNPVKLSQAGLFGKTLKAQQSKETATNSNEETATNSNEETANNSTKRTAPNPFERYLNR